MRTFFTRNVQENDSVLNHGFAESGDHVAGLVILIWKRTRAIVESSHSFGFKRALINSAEDLKICDTLHNLFAAVLMKGSLSNVSVQQLQALLIICTCDIGTGVFNFWQRHIIYLPYLCYHGAGDPALGISHTMRLFPCNLPDQMTSSN